MSVLFIGLGGVGTHTLRNLNEKMIKYHNDIFARTGNAVTEVPKYLFIDTDYTIYEHNKNNFYPLNPNNYFIQIGRRTPDEICAANDEVYSLSRWYDAPNKNTSMILGADAIRQYSRLALLDNYPEIKTTLKTLMANFADADRIYLITGSAGGTGSGIYMDMLFLIDQIYKENATLQRGPNTRFIMAMPNGYIPATANDSLNPQSYKTKLNAFATLQELNDICGDKDTSGGSLFGLSAVVTPDTPRTSFQPFRFGYLYESHNLTPPQVCQQIADFVFEIELAGAEESKHPGQGFDTDLTNKVDSPWNKSIKAKDPYIKAFCALGQFSVEKPDWLWREYFEHRLLHELFHKGLRGDNSRQLKSSIFGQLKKDIGNYIKKAKEKITGLVPTSAFKETTPPLTYWNILTDVYDEGDAVVNQILNCKNQLLENIKKTVFIACRDAMKSNSLCCVRQALVDLDNEYYKNATTLNEKLPIAIYNAKADHKPHVRQDRNIEKYSENVGLWLNYHAARALSSSNATNDDISLVKNKGYLDLCQDFIKIAYEGCKLDNQKEDWESLFKDNVADLKAKDNRYYIPSLDDIVKNGEVVRGSSLVHMYENIIQNHNPMGGTCSIPELHKAVLEDLESNIELKRGANGDEGYITTMFDPDPTNTNTLRTNAGSFMTEYVRTAEKHISAIIKSNQAVQNHFNENIAKRIKSRGDQEKQTIFTRFSSYGDPTRGEVNLHTKSMATGTTQSQVLYISHFNGDTVLQQNLGINVALSSSVIDQPEFSDKIVKLIVNCGYTVSDYRYFDDYKRFAEKELKGTIAHDPFIDKRFLGVPDSFGKYPCDVRAALRKIETDNQAIQQAQQAAQQAQQFSLDGCNDVLVYQYCLALLLKYFETLKAGGKIDTSLADGISTSGNNTIVVKDFTFDELFDEFVLASPITIDMPTVSDINNIVNLSNWIDYVMKKKDQINNEKTLYSEAAKFLRTAGVNIDNDLRTKIVAMMGTGNKPVYDFFNAYLDWYNKD